MRAVILESYMDIIDELDTKEEKCDFILAIINYQMKGIEPIFEDKLLNLLWVAIKPNMDSSIKRYNAKVSNGKKGGRPKTENNLTKPKITKEEPKQNNVKTEQEPIGAYWETQQKLKKEKEKEKKKEMEKKKEPLGISSMLENLDLL